MSSCPLCQVYDGLVNDCIDPCVDYGIGSTKCDQFGCIDSGTTAVQTITAGQKLVPADLLELSKGSLTIVTIVVGALLIFILIVTFIWLRRRSRRSRINHEGKTPQELINFSSAFLWSWIRFIRSVHCSLTPKI